MPKCSSIADENQLATFIVDELIREGVPEEMPARETPVSEKNLAAVALGGPGGLKGGEAARGVKNFSPSSAFPAAIIFAVNLP